MYGICVLFIHINMHRSRRGSKMDGCNFVRISLFFLLLHLRFKIENSDDNYKLYFILWKYLRVVVCVQCERGAWDPYVWQKDQFHENAKECRKMERKNGLLNALWICIGRMGHRQKNIKIWRRRRRKNQAILRTDKNKAMQPEHK